MMNDDCKRYQENYGDVRFDQELAAHANECDSCKAFALKQDALSSVLHEWKAPKAESDFALRVMESIADEVRSPRTLFDLFKQMAYFRVSVPLPVGAMASILLIISLGFNFMGLGEKPVNDALNASIVAQPTMQMPTVQMPNAQSAESIMNYAVPASSNNAMLPSQWTGSGAFLMIPIMPNSPLIDDSENKPDQTKNQDI